MGLVLTGVIVTAVVLSKLVAWLAVVASLSVTCQLIVRLLLLAVGSLLLER